jgi:predicted nucleic-acid-binding protein
MSERRLIDTNLIVRFLVQDHEAHAKIASQLFEACDRGEITFVVLSPVLAECVFVLESFYKHSRTDIAQVLANLLTSPGVELEERAVNLDALTRYGSSKVHFVDCIIAATAAAESLAIATFDSGFRKFKDVRIDLT